ncbi:hypothetical protein T09_4967 [Trichinella sp. T9]|nr:hypothetical protein T09_4967 [Trichinella sp. T9]
MQITIAIKVPYRQLGRTRSFDLRGNENGVDAKRNADGVMQNNKREKVCAVSYLFRFCKTKFERAKVGENSSSENISIALKPLSLLRALPLSIKHISIH